MTQVKAISALDGRYAGKTTELADIFSEYGLIKHRVYVEIEWLKYILNDLGLAGELNLDLSGLDGIVEGFGVKDAEKIKSIERETNHDVKAVEYFVKEKIEAAGMGKIKEWVHFACTSDDINNISYALMLDKGKTISIQILREFLKRIEEMALEYKSIPMMSRTHGQPASPTTVGKEFVNYAWRIGQEIDELERKTVQAKINGATGNFNAHQFVFPDINWIGASEKFLTGSIGLDPVAFTTQINPNASLSFILHALVRTCAVIIDLNRDMWGYISLGYFKQKVKKGEIGSSTMPHKVNPIDFENSEGNMGIAISMLEHLAVKLQKSRFQRDLSDSTVLRSLGSAFGYFLIGVKNSIKGLSKVALDENILNKDLEENPALLAEPFQTAMRCFEEENPYERLKELTRGQSISKEQLDRFVDKLEKVPDEFKSRMKSLTTQTYIGCAEDLVDLYFKRKKRPGGL